MVSKLGVIKLVNVIKLITKIVCLHRKTCKRRFNFHLKYKKLFFFEQTKLPNFFQTCNANSWFSLPERKYSNELIIAHFEYFLLLTIVRLSGSLRISTR